MIIDMSYNRFGTQPGVAGFADIVEYWSIGIFTPPVGGGLHTLALLGVGQ